MESRTYPPGSYITYCESPRLIKEIPCKRKEHVESFIARLREVYPYNDIYITVPSAITAEWQPETA